MPLMKIQKMGKQSAWALWFISETEAELETATSERPEATIINANKRIEWLAGRVLLKTLVEYCGMEYDGIEKDEFGKPFLKTHPHLISLSHSFPYVAAQIDPHVAVGIDLEQPKAKLLTIAHRVLSEQEQQDAGKDVVKHCVYWCAKEAMYKTYGKRGLAFADNLIVSPFSLQRVGDLHGKIDTTGYSKELTLMYTIQPDYVLVHIKP